VISYCSIRLFRSLKLACNPKIAGLKCIYRLIYPSIMCFQKSFISTDLLSRLTMFLLSIFYFFKFLLFCLQISLGFVIIRLFFNNILKSFVNYIFAQHVCFYLLDLFQDNFFVLIVVFIHSITVCFDSVFDHVKNFSRHVNFVVIFKRLFVPL